jgi:hypothetical protein
MDVAVWTRWSGASAAEALAEAQAADSDVSVRQGGLVAEEIEPELRGVGQPTCGDGIAATLEIRHS